ncbi:MAG TPA: ABC transporter ATP-binding protein/permease [Hyphomicrobiaceae bacterium]|jgi:putative ATP-binding cassette transporter|nr:ABC transporter ATP-binding protein/permease [Hyphomicrobiaceae bacterium]
MIDRLLLGIANSRTFLGKLWVLTRPYWFAQDRANVGYGNWSFTVRESWVGRSLLAVIVALNIAIVYMSKLLNAWNARFFNALQEKNSDAFWYELKYWTVLVAIFIITFVYRQWLTQLLTIRWRRWLSHVYFHDWLADRTYYHMELTRHGTDNPEQRIEQDCATFTTQTLSITLGLLLQIMTLVTFAVVLWELSGAFVLPIFGGIVIPGYMMWAAIAYALVGSLATYWIGRPLVKINFDLERYNADFRYRMVRVRENSESIALYGGETDEERRLGNAFTRIYDTWWKYMTYTKRLTGLTAFYGQAASIFPVVVAAPQYFAGKIQLGVLTQTADAFAQVQGSLSWFVDVYAQLAAWKAVVDRLTTFSEAMVKAKTEAAATAFQLKPADKGELVLKGVDVLLPNGEQLLRNVDLDVRQGESVVLRGASGSGKTTLFRVLAGLWPFGRGSIAIPKDARLLFLPQKPYLPIGTLKEVLSYPETPDRYSDEACIDALQACNLPHLASALDSSRNWSLALSGGEQQRVAFARALLYRPDWLFMDEATSALDDTAERRLYELVKRRLPNTTLISIAHDAEVIAFHKRQLTIDPQQHRVLEGAPAAE